QTAGSAPLTITGGNLQGIRYKLPVASAQVKSCVLFAGLGAEGETIVEETRPTRDHSERLLRLMGGKLQVASGNEQPAAGKISLQPGELHGCTIEIPGDLSSAAFFIAAALLLRQSELVIEGVGVNPTRVAFLEALQQMGAQIEISNLRNESTEPTADLFVGHQRLQATTISGYRIPLLIDEIPILAVLATRAEGETLIREAGELRFKESDRLAAVAQNLRAMGAALDELSDGLIIRGPTTLRGAEIDSFGDHRIAMAFAIAGLVADSPTTIRGAEYADISFPGFFEVLRTVCA
ncbi:MAG: 3-phosphoshikimate 1-carboxyvinyltransferase, partial [candidate division KSB1 bacterium]|nr:3-phosphoshikimate 1-carboxyvinyltransferase [candidate division KSB1 bacterium]